MAFVRDIGNGFEKMEPKCAQVISKKENRLESGLLMIKREKCLKQQTLIRNKFFVVNICWEGEDFK